MLCKEVVVTEKGVYNQGGVNGNLDIYYASNSTKLQKKLISVKKTRNKR